MSIKDLQFQNRVEAYTYSVESTYHIQANILRENLLKCFYGKMEHLDFSLDFSQCADLEDFIAHLSDILQCKSSFKWHNNALFYCDRYIAEIEILKISDIQKKHGGVIPESYEYNDEELSAEDNNVYFEDNSIKEIFLNVCYIIADNVVEKIKESCATYDVILNDNNRIVRSKTKVPITLAFPGEHGPVTVPKVFDAVPFSEIEMNYSPAVAAQVKQVIPKLMSAHNGLLLLNGPVGTGKTYMIRSLLTEIYNRRGIVCVPATAFLEDIHSIVSSISNYEKSLVVLEDLGDILASDAASRHIDVRANLLNLTDGLLSLLLNCVVVLSFNHDMSKIDPAILRPGRCIDRIETGLLSKEQAQNLSGLELKSGQYSLAQVYEMKKNNVALDPAPKIGFGR